MRCGPGLAASSSFRRNCRSDDFLHPQRMLPVGAFAPAIKSITPLPPRRYWRNTAGVCIRECGVMAQIETIERLVELIPEPGPIASAKLLDRLDEQALAFVARSPFLLMATESEAGLEISPKGDDPGFTEIVDPGCLIIPERPGNQLKMGLRNILANGRIGLMFVSANRRCPARDGPGDAA